MMKVNRDGRELFSYEKKNKISLSFHWSRRPYSQVPSPSPTPSQWQDPRSKIIVLVALVVTQEQKAGMASSRRQTQKLKQPKNSLCDNFRIYFHAKQEQLFYI